MTQQHPIDWGTVVTLNVVSIFSQLGQFGIGFVVLPVWLAQHGLNATELGIFVSAQWLGMLSGLAIAPRLNVRFGHAKVIAMGLLVAMVAFALVLTLGQSAWLPAVVLIGLGTGLRWIGLEPWLYGIAPTQGRGRLVGFHETMIGIAPIVAPLMTNWVGIEGSGPLVLGLVFTGMAFIPLAFAGAAPKAKLAQVKRAPGQGPSPRNLILALGVATAAIGGITEAAFSGLFPIFGAGRDLSADQMVSLLIYFGLGGLLLQYLMGWLADHRGLVFAVLVNAGMTILMAIVTSFPLGFTGLAVTFFVMGGTGEVRTPCFTHEQGRGGAPVVHPVHGHAVEKMLAGFLGQSHRRGMPLQELLALAFQQAFGMGNQGIVGRMHVGPLSGANGPIYLCKMALSIGPMSGLVSYRNQRAR